MRCYVTLRVPFVYDCKYFPPTCFVTVNLKEFLAILPKLMQYCCSCRAPLKSVSETTRIVIKSVVAPSTHLRQRVISGTRRGHASSAARDQVYFSLLLPRVPFSPSSTFSCRVLAFSARVSRSRSVLQVIYG